MNEYFLTPLIIFTLTIYIGYKAYCKVKNDRARLLFGLRGTKAALWDWNVITDEIFLSSRWAEMLGVGNEDIHAHSIDFRQHFFEEDRVLINKIMDDHFAGNSDIFEIEHRMLHKDGHIVWVQNRGKISEYDKHGKPERVVGTFIDITERKILEEKLKTSERRISYHRENSPLAIIEWNSHYEIVFWNGAAEKLFQYTSSEVNEGCFVNLILSEEFKDKTLVIFAKLFESGKPNSVIINGRNKQGCELICEWNNTPLLDDNNQVLTVTSIIEDLTDTVQKSKQAHDLSKQLLILNEAQQKCSNISFGEFSDYLEHVFSILKEELGISSTRVWMLNSDTNDYDCIEVRVCSEDKNDVNRCFTLSGSLVFLEELKNKKTLLIDEPLDNDFFKDMQDGYLFDTLKHRVLIVGVFHHDSLQGVIGLERSLNSSGWLNHEVEFFKTLSANISLAFEIDKRRKAEKRLASRELELKQILQNMIVGVLSTDKNGIISTFNKTAEKIFEYKSDEVIGQHVNKLLPVKYREGHSQLIKKVRGLDTASLSFKEREVAAVTKSGQTIYLLLSLAIVNQSNKENSYFIASFLDVTSQKAQQEQIRRSQKMDALGKLTSGIAHDYNNMLGVVLGYTEILQEQIVDYPELSSYVDKIQHAGKRAAQLTHKLLSVSRNTTSESKVLNINSFLNDEDDLLRKSLTANIQLKIDLEEPIWDIFVDVNGLEDVLLNLSLNASQAMSGHGVLSISTNNIHLSLVRATALDLDVGDYVVLTVSDTGCGMDANTCEKAFEPFFSTKGEKGSGLGLAQVYGFVSNAGGTIELSTELELGTQFKLYFPRYHLNNNKQSNQKIKIIESQPKIGSTNSGGNECILVVDDEPQLCALAEEILSSYGYHVFTAESGEQALTILENETISLMFSDIIMPNMSGYQLAYLVHQKYPDVLIQLTSGFRGNKEDLFDNFELESPILEKPYSAKQLSQCIRKQLDDKVLDNNASSDLNLKQNNDFITWDDSMSIDNSGLIDQEHKALFSLLNVSYRLNEKNDLHALKKALKTLFEFASEHFETEETMMVECHYPFMENHRNVHQLMLNKLKSVLGTSRLDSKKQWIKHFLTNWVKEHVLVMDKALSPYLVKQNNTKTDE